MPDDYRISDLTTAPSIGNSDLMELSVVNTSSESGYSSMKTPITGLANKIVNGIQYVADLETTAKTITGAINELVQGGGGGGGDADVIKTASGSIASFTTNLEAKLPALKANFLCSGGNGTPSTPIPLVPYTELNVTNCGVNLWDEEWETGTINAQGEPVGDLNNIRSKNFIRVSGSMTFYGVCPYTLLAYYYDENKEFISGAVDITNRTGTTPANACYMKIRTGGYGGTYNDNISINVPDSNHNYIAYNADTSTIDLDGTRYGGYVDANNGKLVVTHGSIDISDCSSVTAWTSGGGLHLVEVPTDTNLNASGISSMLEWKNNNAAWTSATECFAIEANKIRIYTTSTTLADFQTRFADLVIAYELATPIEVDISPEYLNAHTGGNNVFHDGNGDVELSYFTNLAGDIKNFINADVGLDDLDDVVITSPSANQVLKYDGNKWVNGTGGGGGVPWVEITGTLLAGNVILLWASNPNIHADSTVDIYVDTAFYGVAPLTVALSEGNLTLTFEPQSADMPVKVRLS